MPIIKLRNRPGASLIIGMILVVLIISYSIGLAKSTIGIKQNIRLNLEYNKHQSNQQKLNTLAANYVATGENPYVVDAPGQDFAFQKTIDNKTYTQDVWYTTGCPIPNRNDGNGETYSSLLDKTPADLSQEYKIYNENGLVQTKTIAEKCGLSETNDEAYFVYPTPLVKNANLATSDCLSNYALNSYIKDELVNPLDHPCYWSKLEAGKSKTITLNDWYRDYSNVETLILRVRPTCPRGQAWCTDQERYDAFFDYNLPPYKTSNYDISPTALTWELNFNDGEYLFGSTKGRIADIKQTFEDYNVNCTDPRFSCRQPESSEYTIAELQSKTNFNLIDLGNRTLGGNTNKIYIDFIKDRSEESNRIFNNQDTSILVAILRITNELRFFNNSRFEYQVLSNYTFPR